MVRKFCMCTHSVQASRHRGVQTLLHLALQEVWQHQTTPATGQVAGWYGDAVNTVSFTIALWTIRSSLISYSLRLIVSLLNTQ